MVAVLVFALGKAEVVAAADAVVALVVAVPAETLRVSVLAAVPLTVIAPVAVAAVPSSKFFVFSELHVKQFF